MAQSLNTKVDYTVKATSYTGFNSYGNVMIGDKAFEYYNEKNTKDNIQIPWEEIDYIAASVYFNKYITRFAVFLKNYPDRYFSFSTRNNKATLRACKAYIPADRLQKSISLVDVIRNGLKSIFHMGKKK